MNHQKLYEYKQTIDDVWHPVSAEELLFHIIPSGAFFSYRLHIVNLDDNQIAEEKQ